MGKWDWDILGYTGMDWDKLGGTGGRKSGGFGGENGAWRGLVCTGLYWDILEKLGYTGRDWFVLVYTGIYWQGLGWGILWGGMGLGGPGAVQCPWGCPQLSLCPQPCPQDVSKLSPNCPRAVPMSPGMSPSCPQIPSHVPKLSPGCPHVPSDVPKLSPDPQPCPHAVPGVSPTVPVSPELRPFQALPFSSLGAEPFALGGHPGVALAQPAAGACALLEWDQLGGSFRAQRVINGSSPVACHPVPLGDTLLLVVAQLGGGSWVWRRSGGPGSAFVRHQALGAGRLRRPHAVAAARLAGHLYLGVADSSKGGTSTVFRWASGGFYPHQALRPWQRDTHLEFLELGGRPALVLCGAARRPLVYRWSGDAFAPHTDIPHVPDAYAAKHFRLRGSVFLCLTRFLGDAKVMAAGLGGGGVVVGGGVGGGPARSWGVSRDWGCSGVMGLWGSIKAMGLWGSIKVVWLWGSIKLTGLWGSIRVMGLWGSIKVMWS
uniref:Uncharacterized protein n=1 Tax=Taeniopygia guttata TaxID=59729 RepID=A0A674G9L2_TAEGU